MMTHKFAIFALSKVFIIFIRKSQCVWGALGQEKNYNWRILFNESHWVRGLFVAIIKSAHDDDRNYFEEGREL